MKNKNIKNTFPGFPIKLNKRFWKYPQAMDNFWCELNGSEQKVMDFILRRTYGFQKLADRISLSQFENGVGKIDKGTGLNRRTILRSTASLEKKGFIRIKKYSGWINHYELATESIRTDDKNNTAGSDKNGIASSDKNGTNTGDRITLTINSSNTINKTIDNSIDIYTNDFKEFKDFLENLNSKNFDFNNCLTKMLEYQGDQRYACIIAKYFMAKELVFDTCGKFQSAIKHSIYAAKDLAHYNDKEIDWAIEECKMMEYWSFGTIMKVFTSRVIPNLESDYSEKESEEERF